MRNIHEDTLAQFAGEELRTFFLFDLVLDSAHYRYTECDVPILESGVLFMPRGLSIGQIRYAASSIIDATSVEIDNVDSELTQPYVEGASQGSDATLKFCCVDALGAIEGEAVTVFPGLTDDWYLDEQTVKQTIRSEISTWTTCTLCLYSPSCRWEVFGGDECCYAGTETSCDRTYARCAALGNTAHFGGERWISSIVGTDIWWGRSKGGAS